MSLAISAANRARAVSEASRSASTGLDRGNRSRFEVLDPRASAVQPLALLTLLRDGHSQCLLGCVERPGGVAHLLVEDQQRVLIGDLLGDSVGASSDECD